MDIKTQLGQILKSGVDRADLVELGNLDLGACLDLSIRGITILHSLRIVNRHFATEFTFSFGQQIIQQFA